MGLNSPDLEKVAEVNETSFKDLLINIKGIIQYLKSKWLWILLFGFISGLAGYLYSKTVKTVYSADCTFVLDEESDSKGGGNLAALGLGIGGKGGDFFTATDNIIWLYSTRLMLQKTLLTPVDLEGKKVLLINKFLTVSGLQKEFANHPKLKSVKFDLSTNDSTLSLEQNAVIGRCTNLIKTKYLKAILTPKTENVISVSFKSTNELFAEAFANELVRNVNGYYIQTKTKKASEEVALLEQKASQYRAEMSSDIYQVASGYDNAPYPNPNRQVLKVAPQQKQVDAKISGEIYSGLVQQLELSRTNLQKQMPLIQIIEEPIRPLNYSTGSPVMSSVICFVIGVVLTMIIFLLIRAIRKLENSK